MRVFKIPDEIPEIVRLVVEAVVAVIIVVDAYGMRSDAVDGAEKFIVRPPAPTSAPVPESVIAVPCETDDVATDWREPDPEP